MAKHEFTNGVTSVRLRIKIQDSSKTDGSGLTGLTSGAGGLIISTIADTEATATVYTGANIETITTLGTFAAPTAGKCRFKEVDATNHKGVYEIQIADARWAVTNARSLMVSVAGATDAVETDAEVQLTAGDIDNLDAAVTTRATPTQVKTQADQALVDARLDHLLKVAVVGADVADNSIFARLVSKAATADWDTYNNTTDALEAIRDTPPLGTAMRGTDAAALASAYTAARAAILDNLAIGGLVASQADVQAIQNNTRTTVSLNGVMERPGSGVTRYRIYLNNYDTVGNMEAPDSAPTVSVVNETGASRSGNLLHPTTHVPQTTMVLDSTGRYWIEFELDAADPAPEQLLFTFTVVEATVSRVFDRGVQVLDTTAPTDPEVLKTGTVAASPAPTATSLSSTALSEATTDFWVNKIVHVTSGAAAGLTARITAFDAGADTITFDPALVVVPAAGDTFDILRQHAAAGLTSTEKAKVVTAARMVANKKTHSVADGVNEYYDDAGTGVLVTETPTEIGGVVTVNMS